jgi:hypothetical protein
MDFGDLSARGKGQALLIDLSAADHPDLVHIGAHELR